MTIAMLFLMVLEPSKIFAHLCASRDLEVCLRKALSYPKRVQKLWTLN